MDVFNSKNVEMMEKACGLCIAKTGVSEEGTSLFLPLSLHMLDTAGIMVKLFDHRIPLQVQNWFSKLCGSREKARALFLLTGLLHDLGKATSVFQYRIYQSGFIPVEFPEEFAPSNKYGFTPESHHSRLGMMIAMKEGFSQSFASLLGAHHGRTQKSVRQRDLNEFGLVNTYDLYGGPGREKYWTEMWHNICAAALSLSGFENSADIPELEAPELMVLAGYLSEADWISSNTSFFPLIQSLEVVREIRYPERINQGWKRIGLPDRWNPENGTVKDHSFRHLFGFEPRAFQKEVEDTVKQIENPGLLIVEAPMGLGKTEAALMAADVFSRKDLSGGVFIGLPTQATANGLLVRFRQWAEKEAGSQSLTFRLSHGAASMNRNYTDLLKDRGTVDEDGPAEGNERASLFIHNWMSLNRLALFADFSIGTVDQALMAGLDHRYVSLRIAGLAGKIVIIDEVHSYDAYMNGFLRSLLGWMSALQVPVILLSATLPEFVRSELIWAYLKGKGLRGRELNSLKEALTDSGYPGITWTDENKIFTRSLRYDGKHTTVRIEKETYSDKGEELNSILNHLQKKLEKGGCAGVVMNTVRAAQDLYALVSSSMQECRVILIHSAFTASDRRIIEDRILELAGKKSTPAERDKLIVIGTQVIEQSLDLDFDFMISELAPMDLLLQRIGRLHRHERTGRPMSLENPELLVLGPDNEILLHKRSVYYPWILFRTKNLLPDSIQIPDEIPDLVNSAYMTTKPAELKGYERELYEAYLNGENSKSMAAKAYELGIPAKRRVNTGINDVMRSQSITDSNTAENSVRQIDPSLEVILLRKQDEMLLSPDAMPFSFSWKLGETPEKLKLDEVLSKKVRVPQLYSNELDLAEQEVVNEMKETGLYGSLPSALRNECFVILDDRNSFELVGKKYIYSSKTGIQKIDV